MAQAASLPQPSTGHLCVFVHGLWGNPKHLNYVASRLREQYPQDSLHILQVARNSGSFTYDGIELGAERVTKEIEEKLEQLERDGQAVKKLSIIGYSLGGLVSRYAVGLLFHNGWFDTLEPVNFTTFATPHLGVRTPLKGIYNRLFNVIGARTLSTSGHQLFMIDEFRETGKPILTVMTEPDGIFMRALALFKHRSLYSNIINDRSAVFYTTCISPTDPYADLSLININYLKAYEPVILDPENPVVPKYTQADTSTSATSTSKAIIPYLSSSGAVIKQAPFYAFLVVWVPIGLTLFLLNAGVQSVQSQKRIRLHQQGKAGIPAGLYQIPLAMRRVGEEMYEEVNQKQGEEYLSPEEESVEDADADTAAITTSADDVTATEPQANVSMDLSIPSSRPAPQSQSSTHFPTLALHPAQFTMIASLNALGWRKYPVHIQKARHSHAAIIRRMDRQSFDEGSVVVGHWVREFEI